LLPPLLRCHANATAAAATTAAATAAAALALLPQR
jgi:hypothetical protein